MEKINKAGKPILLMILDGWGMPVGGPGDALSIARINNFHYLWHNYPHTTLGASGHSVGLPEGQMGNSEVGHMNIGCGRVIYQDFTKINKAIAEGQFFHNKVLLSAMANVKNTGAALHLVGLLSDGGVHSHIRHLFALMELAKNQGVKELYIHCITDGRDTPPDSAVVYVEMVEEEIKRLGIGSIATITGRYYTMDRDNRWERVEKGYRAMVKGEGNTYHDAKTAILDSYKNGVTDEFIIPALIVDDNNSFNGRIKDGDSVIFYNFRSDRAREITRALTEKDFDKFDRGDNLPRVHYVCFTNYSEDIVAPVAFPEEQISNCLGDVLAQNGLKQLRIAETEKYPHVTFFFNAGEEDPFDGEDRVLVPSPKVATYDLKPEMSALEVTEKVLSRLENGNYDLIVLNYANPDMVGHTGIITATVKALDTVDDCLGRIYHKMKKAGGTLIVTADHGNVEKMLDHNNGMMTAHTTSRVPFILIDDRLIDARLKADGDLCDIAPSILELLGVKKPQDMTGQTLFIDN